MRLLILFLMRAARTDLGAVALLPPRDGGSDDVLATDEFGLAEP